MQGNYLFEYAVIRIVPRVEREEFLNVGIILYCKDQQFLHARFHLNEEKLLACCGWMDIALLKDYLLSFEKICKGEKGASPIAELDIASRFRWLTATRSSVLQTSKVHPGFTNDPAETLERLHEQLVL
jgi:hypothetical protein